MMRKYDWPFRPTLRSRILVAIRSLHPFHELAHLLELFQQAIHFLDGPTGPLRDPQLARSAQHGWIGTLRRRHRQHDRLDVFQALVVQRRTLQRLDLHPRKEVEHLLERAHRLHLLQGSEEILQVHPPLRPHLLLEPLGGCGIHRSGRLLHQRDDVTLPENPARPPGGIERAAPPPPSPSSFVRITPVSPTASWNPRAMLTASWPVIPSATSTISRGVTAALSARSSSIISGSICSRPAVSTITVRARADSASRNAPFTRSTTFLVSRFPNTGPPICAPSCSSCSRAAGRYTSAATRAGAFCSSLRRRASFAAVVVLPEPCNPTSRMTVGPTEAKSRPVCVAPSSVAISSCTSFTTCWPGVTALSCSPPIARSRTRSTNPRVTSKFTSASRR